MSTDLASLEVRRNATGRRHLIDFIRTVCDRVIKDEDVVTDLVKWVNTTFNCRWSLYTKQTLNEITMGSTGFNFFSAAAWRKFESYVLRRIPKNEGDVSNWVMLFHYHYYNPNG